MREGARVGGLGERRRQLPKVVQTGLIHQHAVAEAAVTVVESCSARHHPPACRTSSSSVAVMRCHVNILPLSSFALLLTWQVLPALWPACIGPGRVGREGKGGKGGKGHESYDSRGDMTSGKNPSFHVTNSSGIPVGRLAMH